MLLVTHRVLRRACEDAGWSLQPTAPVPLPCLPKLQTPTAGDGAEGVPGAQLSSVKVEFILFLS